jgi:hypothetical protein
MHAGRIGVESRVGHGSTFSVVLVRDPRTGIAQAAGGSEPPPASPAAPASPVAPAAPRPDEVANSS